MLCRLFIAVLLVLLQGPILLTEELKCPVGFQLSYTNSTGRAICYKLKGPEAFEDFYKDCVGNKFSVKLYHDLNISSSKQIWTEYSSFYPGGPFIDTHHTDNYGYKLRMANLIINRNISLDEEWCIVLDPYTNMTVVKCSEKYYRYCFVEPYPHEDGMSDEAALKGRALKTLDMRLTINYKINRLKLTVNKTDCEKLACYTDSNKENPEEMTYTVCSKAYDGGTIIYLSLYFKLNKNGYYWCLHNDVTNFVPSESNKVLYIKGGTKDTNVRSIYAIKIGLNEPYDSKNLSSILKRTWTTKIEKYIYYKYRYQLEHGRLNSTLAETDLMNFVENNITVDMESVSYDVKRSYLDFRTVLVHATLDSKFDQYMGFMSPGSWQGVQVLSVKPVYYCNGIFYNIQDTFLGSSVNASHCRTYHCVGDYMEGVEFLQKRTEGCVSPTQVVIPKLESLVNKTAVSAGELEDTFDQVDKVLMEHDDDLENPGQLLHLLDQLGSTVALNETGQGQAVRPNIALLMADAQPDNPVRGFRTSIINDTFQDQDFNFLSGEPNSTIMNESEVVVILPSSVSDVQRRVSFVVFRDDRAFNSPSSVVNSRVVSVNIENVTHFHEGEFIDIYLKPIVTVLARNESRSCAYWHFLEDDTNSGYWSQEGCTLIRATENGMVDTCRCNHLTHFALLITRKAVFSKINESALEIITLVGCILSMVGLIIIGITAVLFRSWRREYTNKIWLQLCMAIFMLVLSFLLVIFVNFDQYDVACLLVGILLHYAVLASFCWMLVAAVQAYRQLVAVFSLDAPHKLLKAAAFSWGAPCVVIGVLLSVSRLSYGRTFEEKTPIGAFCYPTGLGLWLTVHAPMMAILFTNWMLFASIVRSVFDLKRSQRPGKSNEALRCVSVSCVLVFLFGLPWVFGLFASDVVGAYLFTLTATFQGFILFVFFVIGSKKTRDLWLNMFHNKQTRNLNFR